MRKKLRKYFSGKLVLVQLGAGVGAFAFRSGGVYLAQGQPMWAMVLASLLGGTLGYVGTYVLGYWLAFRADYRLSGRSMVRDVVQLQLVEQCPNIFTLFVSGLTQGALMEVKVMPPVVAANLGSWFGPQKIINLAAMLAGNSLKRAWVDGSWKPLAAALRLVHGVAGLLKRVPLLHREPAPRDHPGYSRL